MLSPSGAQVAWLLGVVENLNKAFGTSSLLPNGRDEGISEPNHNLEGVYRSIESSV